MSDDEGLEVDLSYKSVVDSWFGGVIRESAAEEEVEEFKEQKELTKIKKKKKKELLTADRLIKPGVAASSFIGEKLGKKLKKLNKKNVEREKEVKQQQQGQLPPSDSDDEEESKVGVISKSQISSSGNQICRHTIESLQQMLQNEKLSKSSRKRLKRKLNQRLEAEQSAVKKKESESSQDSGLDSPKDFVSFKHEKKTQKKHKNVPVIGLSNDPIDLSLKYLTKDTDTMTKNSKLEWKEKSVSNERNEKIVPAEFVFQKEPKQTENLSRKEMKKLQRKNSESHKPLSPDVDAQHHSKLHKIKQKQQNEHDKVKQNHVSLLSEIRKDKHKKKKKLQEFVEEDSFTKICSADSHGSVGVGISEVDNFTLNSAEEIYQKKEKKHKNVPEIELSSNPPDLSLKYSTKDTDTTLKNSKVKWNEKSVSNLNKASEKLVPSEEKCHKVPRGWITDTCKQTENLSRKEMKKLQRLTETHQPLKMAETSLDDAQRHGKLHKIKQKQQNEHADVNKNNFNLLSEIRKNKHKKKKKLQEYVEGASPGSEGHNSDIDSFTLKNMKKKPHSAEEIFQKSVKRTFIPSEPDDTPSKKVKTDEFVKHGSVPQIQEQLSNAFNMKKKKKIRSKQKNIRKDNRPEHLKPQHLQMKIPSVDMDSSGPE